MASRFVQPCAFSRGKDLLVDGGYTDNLPILQMVFVILFCCHVFSCSCIAPQVRLKPRHGIGCIIASDVERRDNSSLREVHFHCRTATV
jgi:hypothetical protein